MDTILFFCKKRGLQEPSIEPIGMKSHLLIRICLDVGQEAWFGFKVVPESREILPTWAGTEGERKSTEGREQNTDGGRKSTEGREQNTDGGRKKPEGREQNTDGGRKKPEGRGQDTMRWGKKAERRGQSTKGDEEKAEGGTKGRHYGLLQALTKLFDHREKCAEKEYRRAKEQERIRLLQERQRVLNKVEEDIQKLVSDILGMIGSWEGCFCVYEDDIYRALEGRKNDNCIETRNIMESCKQDGNGMKEEACMQEEIGMREETYVKERMGSKEKAPIGMEAVLPVLWKKYFRIQEFDHYTKQLWVEELLPESVLPHFVILGTVSCLPILIEKYADRMKSLRWILPENDYSQEVQDFVEDFYMEYGLAIMLQITPAGQRRLQAECTQPSNVLDFTEEANINLTKVAKGSIWLDMLSMEEKKRRIVGRSTGITYVSLKEKWKLVRKKEPFVPEISLTPDEKVV